MLQRINQVKEILNHPSNRAHRMGALLRYLKWNIGRRLLNQADYVVSVNAHARVVLSNRENYATLAYTCGMYDFDEMQFLLHLLKPGDVFGDFGANVGVYSALAGTAGASVLAVEPVPDTYARLLNNFALNGVNGRAVQCGLSDCAGKLRFTRGLGGLNHVARPQDEDVVEVDVLTVDQLVARTGLAPLLVKIDVEGFELPLLRGGADLLAHTAGIIIELNGSGKPYGFQDSDVHGLLVSAGFGCFDYQPDTRQLCERAGFHRDRFNTIYLKRGRLDEIRLRLR